MSYLLTLFLLCANVYAVNTPKRAMHAFQSDVEDRRLLSLAEKTDQTIDAILKVAVDELEDEGFKDEAYQIKGVWETSYKGYLTSAYKMDPDGKDGIGDHPTEELSHWLTSVYKRIELVLGKDTCVMLHICDLWVLSVTIKIVFNPCKFDMAAITIPRRDEYRNNFVGDGTYPGFSEIVVWWTVELICSASTSGAGTMLCGPLAMGAEWLCGHFICPKISDGIFDRSCGG